MDTDQPRYWVMLDCCYSGAGGMEALTSALAGTGTRTTWVIALAQQGKSAAAQASGQPRT